MSTTTLPEGHILIRNARLSYPKLFRAEAVKNDDAARPRYGCNLLVAKSDEATMAKVNGEIARLAKEKMKSVMPKKKDISIRDGDGEDGDEHSAGCWIISANRQESQGRPTVLDRDRSPLTESDSKPYAGCYVNAVVGVYSPKNWAGKVCFSLEVVQFAKDGEPFGAERIDPGVMPDLSVEDDGGEEGFGL